jgi:SAM-dependent methyltransferase
MIPAGASFDPVWEERYRSNPAYRNHYPWSSVVSFVYRYRPSPAGALTILEVGCGNAANLWFAAREGHTVAGVDASETAIAYGRDWFNAEGLAGDLRVGDFSTLPFPDASFDMAVDRGALSFAGTETAACAIAEIRRVLRPGGRFMFTPYSDRCTSFDGLPDADGCYRKVSKGSIVPGAMVRFYSVAEVRTALADGWRFLVLEHQEYRSEIEPRTVHAEWMAIVEKTA